MENEGFLSAESAKSIEINHRNYSSLFEFIKEFNSFVMSLIKDNKIEWADKRLLVINALYLRIVENFQSIVLLIERGIMSPSKVLTRAMVENMFTLVALQKKPELIENYNDQHLQATKRSLKASLQFDSKELLELAKKENTEQKYIDIKNEIGGRTLNVLSPKDWAKHAELEDFYRLFYVHFSSHIHSNLTALDDHIDTTEDNIELAFGPSDKNLTDIADCIVNTLEVSTFFWGQANQKDYSEKLQYFKEKYLKNKE